MATEPELPEDEAQAAELAIGLLEGETRAAALRRVLAEPRFATMVADWQDRLAPLLLAYPEATPSDGVWPRIQAAIGGAVVRTGGGWWKAATAAGFALAATLAGVLLLRPAPPPEVIVREAPPAPRLAAPLVPGGTETAILANYDPRQARIHIAAPVLPADTRTPELWVVPADGTPRSLGLIARTGETELTLRAEVRALLGAGATLAVSLEPAGGSPTGLPTGPIIATGQLTTL